jgi:hypothetical protein
MPKAAHGSQWEWAESSRKPRWLRTWVLIYYLREIILIYYLRDILFEW